MISILIVIFIAGDAYSAVVGHDAEKIRSGTFGSGNYTFPDSVFITNYFGIGTISPVNNHPSVTGGCLQHYFQKITQTKSRNR